MRFFDGFTQTILCDFLAMGLFAILLSVFAIIFWIVALCRGLRKTEHTKAAIIYSFSIPWALLASFLFLKIINAAPPAPPPGSNLGECLALQVAQVSPLAYSSGLAVMFVTLGLYIWLACFIGKKAEQWLKIDTTDEQLRADARERSREIGRAILASRRGGN